MSDQPPLVPPTPPKPPSGHGRQEQGFEPYAPNRPDLAGEAPAGMQPPAYGTPYQVAPQYLAHPAAPTHPLAITSLVLGIVSIVSVLLALVLYVTVVGGICAPFAIWLGARAKREIRQNPQLYGGEGLAVAGLVTGIVGTVLAALALVLILIAVLFVAVVFSSFGP